MRIFCLTALFKVIIPLLLITTSSIPLSIIQQSATDPAKSDNNSQSIVYITEKIKAASLLKIYEALPHNLLGKVTVKISTGGHNFLAIELIKDLVQAVNGTISELNTEKIESMIALDTRCSFFDHRDPEMIKRIGPRKLDI